MSDQSEDLDKVRKAVEVLSEHFDTVHVFVTRYEGGEDYGTVNIQMGYGNWFARKGQVEQWLVKDDEDIRSEVRKEES